MNKPDMKTQLISKVTELLVILRNNNSTDRTKQSLFYSRNEKTVVKIMTYPEYEQFSAPAKLLLGQKGLSKKFSE